MIAVVVIGRIYPEERQPGLSSSGEQLGQEFREVFVIGDAVFGLEQSQARPEILVLGQMTQTQKIELLKNREL
ncbi:hypothetical protein D3C85_1247100 [compost metagenome]